MTVKNAPKKKVPKQNWKVVYYLDKRGVQTRVVFGRRDAQRAWKLYRATRTVARRLGHIRDLELWRGSVKIF